MVPKAVIGWAAAALALAAQPALLQPEDFRHHVELLNRNDAEDVSGGVPN